MEDLLAETFEHLALVVDIFGVAIILIGSLKFALGWIILEVGRIRGLACANRIRELRLELGSYILAALEIMIVSDILHTMIHHGLEDLYELGLLVIIRTAIGFFLGQELKDIEGAEEAKAKKLGF